MDLQKKFNLTYLFIAHDLRIVEHVSDRIAVMYLGKIVEIASSLTFFNRHHHPYSIALLSAVPVPNPRLRKRKDRVILGGEIPSPLNLPKGCVFHPRCVYKTDICLNEIPILRSVFTKCPETPITCPKFVLLF